MLGSFVGTLGDRAFGRAIAAENEPYAARSSFVIRLPNDNPVGKSRKIANAKGKKRIV